MRIGRAFPQRSRILAMVLWPLARFCVRHNFSVQEVIAKLKFLYLEATRLEIEASGIKVNVSRLSLGTGMHRGEVTRLLRSPPAEELPLETLNVVARVIGQWNQDRRYLTAAGKPRILSFEEPDSEFRELARSISTAVHSGSILLELERIGAVERTPEGLKLMVQADPGGANTERSSQLLSKDLHSLLTAVTENMLKGEAAENLHIRTEYDNIYTDALPEVKLWLIERGRAFHREIREFLARHDKDLGVRVDPKAQAGCRVVVTSFGMAEVPNEAPQCKN